MDVLLPNLVPFFIGFFLSHFIFFPSSIIILSQSDNQEVEKSSDNCNLNVLEVVSYVFRLRMFCEIFCCIFWFLQREIRLFFGFCISF